MNNKSLERYIALRTEIKTEVADIDAQIFGLQNQINNLEQRKKELVKVLNDDDIPAVDVSTEKSEAVASENSENPTVDTLLSYLRQNPGSSRQNIREHFNGDITEKQMSQLFERCRKRGLILNRGNTRNARWYVVEQGSPEAS